MPNNIDFTTIGLGEIINVPLATSLPNTAYNGINVVLSTGSVVFSGGVYELSMPSVCTRISNINYQAHVGYRIDGGNWVLVLDWALWGNDETSGSVSFTAPVAIPAGTHTLDIGFGTNNNGKTITVIRDQAIRAYLAKIGA